MPTPITSIGQIAITTNDVPRAVAFYRDRLGLDYLFEAGSLAFFECGGVRLMLAQPEAPEFDHPNSIIYFRVDDIDAARSELVDRGVPFDDEPHLIARMPDHELWMTFFRNPDANVHGLNERGQVEGPRTTDSSRPRSSGTVTLERSGSA